MQASQTITQQERPLPLLLIGGGLSLVPLLLLLLRLVPHLDYRWESPIGHFWFVFIAVLIILLLVGLIIQTALFRRDGRVFALGIGLLVLSLTFLVHAVATPGVVFENTLHATQWSTPFALLGTAIVFAASTNQRFDEWLMRHWRSILLSVVSTWSIYVLIMLLYIPQHVHTANPHQPTSQLSTLDQIVNAVPMLFPIIAWTSISLYIFTAWTYLKEWRKQPTLPLATFSIAAILLAESALSAQYGVLWHVSFWMYHVLLLIAVLVIVYGVIRRIERTGSVNSAVDGLLLQSTLQRQNEAFNNAMQVLLTAFESGDQQSMPTLRKELRQQFALAEDQLDLVEQAVNVVAQDRREASRLQALVDMSQTMNLELEANVLIERVLNSLVRTTEPTFTAVGLIHNEQLVIQPTHYFINNQTEREQITLPIEVLPTTWFATTDIAHTTELNSVIPKLEIEQPAWIFPLLQRTNLLGVLIFVPSTSTLDTRLENVLQSLAAHLATALSNTNLYHELQQEHVNLQRSERIREQFNQMIVHDLKNPLTAIINYLDLIKRTPTEQQDLLIDGARRSSRVMMGLVADLLDTARLQEGQLVLKQQSYNLASLLHEITADFRAWAKEEAKIINVHVHNPLIWLTIDADLMKRVLTNLVSNAIKHTPNQTTITLSSEERTDALVIAVRDNGYGIPSEQQANLFERFGTLDSANGDRYRSTGLGLYFCKLAVERHGGTIRVISKLQQGSTFEISLPLSLVTDASVNDLAQVSSR